MLFLKNFLIKKLNEIVISNVKQEVNKNIIPLEFELKQNLLQTEKKIIENMQPKIFSDNLKKGVIYTCITGNYDTPSIPEYVNPEFDYVCFTDSKELQRTQYFGVWKIKPLEFDTLDNTRNQRWHKTHPHILFPEYNLSIFHDSNITIRSNWIFDEIEKKKIDLIIPEHCEHDCIYDEIKTCREAKRDDEDSFTKMHSFLEKSKFPEHYGLNETNLIVRKHNEKEIIGIMEEWWSFIQNYTKRDQLSLSYVLWKHEITPQQIAIPNLRTRYADFLFSTHSIISASKADLPDYSISKESFTFKIESFKNSATHSFVSGWACIPEHKTRIFISTGSSLIYSYNTIENKMFISFELSKKYGTQKIIKPMDFKRPDIQALLKLNTPDIGFFFELNEFLPSFTLYLADDTEKKLYMQEIKY